MRTIIYSFKNINILKVCRCGYFKGLLLKRTPFWNPPPFWTPFGTSVLRFIFFSQKKDIWPFFSFPRPLSCTASFQVLSFLLGIMSRRLLVYLSTNGAIKVLRYRKNRDRRVDFSFNNSFPFQHIVPYYQNIIKSASIKNDLLLWKNYVSKYTRKLQFFGQDLLKWIKN